MSSWFVTYGRATNPTHKVICFHPAGGSASQFRTWSEHFSNEISIIALQLPGREDRFNEEKITEFSSIIPILLKEIKPHLTLPYVIVGHSLGALIGFELIRNLQIQRYPLPKILVVAAKEPPHLHHIPSRSNIIDDKWLVERLKSYNAVPSYLFQFEEFSKIFLPYIRNDFLLLSSYLYSASPKLRVPVLALYGTEDKTVSLNKINSWGDLTEDTFQLKRFKGGYFFIKEEEKKVLEHLSSFL
jgi:medium-chain acyl-[acyl-carrier-protein] hydrolase